MTSLIVHEPSLIVLCGPAGSGKSTFARRCFAPTEVLNADAIRGMLTDDEAHQGVNAEAFEILHRIAEVRLARGLLTVIDATNLEEHARQPLRRLARHARLPTHLVIVDADLETVRAWNSARGRTVEDAVLRAHVQMLDSLGATVEKERWDRVTRVRAEDLDHVEVVRTPLPPLRFGEAGPFDLIGDVHGCLSELRALLGELGYAADGSHPEGRRMVFVGDLVDRGPDSVGVLREVVGWVEGGHALFVPGNHDDKFARWLEGRAVKVTGGLATTVAEWEQLSEPQARLLGRRFLALMEESPPYLWLDGGRLLVSHAGLEEPDHGRVGGAVRAFCLFGKTTGKSIDGYPERLDWAADYAGAPYVVHGHVPVRLAQWRNQVADIDLGVVFGGELCAVRWPERTFVTVPAEQAWWGGARWGVIDPPEEATG